MSPPSNNVACSGRNACRETQRYRRASTLRANAAFPQSDDRTVNRRRSSVPPPNVPATRASCTQDADRKAIASARAGIRLRETSARAPSPRAARTLAGTPRSSSRRRRCSHRTPPNGRAARRSHRRRHRARVRCAGACLAVAASTSWLRRPETWADPCAAPRSQHQESPIRAECAALVQLAARERDHAQSVGKPHLVRMRKRNAPRRSGLRHSGCDHALTAKYSIVVRFCGTNVCAAIARIVSASTVVVARHVVVEQARRATHRPRSARSSARSRYRSNARARLRNRAALSPSRARSRRRRVR